MRRVGVGGWAAAWARAIDWRREGREREGEKRNGGKRGGEVKRGCEWRARGGQGMERMGVVGGEGVERRGLLLKSRGRSSGGEGRKRGGWLEGEGGEGRNRGGWPGASMTVEKDNRTESWSEPELEVGLAGLLTPALGDQQGSQRRVLNFRQNQSSFSGESF